MANPLNCLVVDDENDIRELIVMTLTRMGLKADSAANLDDAKFMLRQKSYALCLTDMRLPDGNGLDLVRYINQHHAGLPVAVITAYGSADNAVSALKAGAFDYITKPISLQQLRPLVQSALNLPNAAGNVSGPSLVGESSALQQIRATITKLSRNQAPVFISGEAGTGKSLVARLIHQASSRQSGAFITLDCSAIPEQQLEKEIFGDEDEPGALQKASGGTLFFKEIAALPLASQVRLLRAIQDKSISIPGQRKEETIDVRIISASQRNLTAMMERGQFRQDLYYRLNVIALDLPALRDIPEDIAPISQYLLKRLCQAQKIDVPLIARETQQMLLQHYYPGNVRELETILERALTLHDGRSLQPADLRLQTESKRVALEIEANGLPLPDYLESIEKQAILNALEKTGHNKTAAAKLLGVSFRTLRYRLSKLGLGKDSDGDEDED